MAALAVSGSPGEQSWVLQSTGSALSLGAARGPGRGSGTAGVTAGAALGAPGRWGPGGAGSLREGDPGPCCPAPLSPARLS